MKKKLLVCFCLLLFTSGCTSLKQESYDSIVSLGISSSLSLQNTYRSGYKYYLPKGLKMLNHEGSNEIFSFEDIIFHMYVDRVSYFHNVRKSYDVKSDIFYSRELLQDDKFGYLEIKNLENQKYFVEIMYNYAKIEVIVDKEMMPDVLAYSTSILSSISYQDEVLASLMGEDALTTSEVLYNIFESAETESEYLQIVEEYGQYEEKDELVDPDFIRR